MSITPGPKKWFGLSFLSALILLISGLSSLMEPIPSAQSLSLLKISVVYIEIWYRKKRRHSYLGYKTIEEFNREYTKRIINKVA